MFLSNYNVLTYGSLQKYVAHQLRNTALQGASELYNKRATSSANTELAAGLSRPKTLLEITGAQHTNLGYFHIKICTMN
jgi:hypothetical protein